MCSPLVWTRRRSKARSARRGAGAREVADALAEAKASKVSGEAIRPCDRRRFDPGAGRLALRQARNRRRRTPPADRAAGSAAPSALRRCDRRRRCSGLAGMWRRRRCICETSATRFSTITSSPKGRRSCRPWAVIGSRDWAAQLFDRIEGDYFAILGLPLLPVLDYLRVRGAIES